MRGWRTPDTEGEVGKGRQGKPEARSSSAYMVSRGP